MPDLSRRGFLSGLIGAIAAPAIVRPEIIMPIRGLVMATDQAIDGLDILYGPMFVAQPEWLSDWSFFVGSQWPDLAERLMSRPRPMLTS